MCTSLVYVSGLHGLFGKFSIQWLHHAARTPRRRDFFWLARLLSFKRPLLSVNLSVYLCDVGVCVRQLRCQISRKLSDVGVRSCPIGILWESPYGASIGAVIDDVA